MGALSLGYCVFFAPRTCWAGWPSAKTFWAYRGFRDNIRFGCAGILMVRCAPGRADADICRSVPSGGLGSA